MKIEEIKELRIKPMLGVARRRYDKYGFEALAADLVVEAKEVGEAWDKTVESNEDDEYNKHFAHTAEELYDLATRCASALYVMQEMQSCPCKDLVQSVANQVYYKDHARGYDNGKYSD